MPDSSFPASLDDFPTEATLRSRDLDDATLDHPAYDHFVNDAVRNLEEKVGIDGSGDATSLDYKTAASEAHIADTLGAHNASAIGFDPTGLVNTIATDVQQMGEDFDAAIASAGISPSIFTAPGSLITSDVANAPDELLLGAAHLVLAVNAAGTALGYRDAYALPQSIDTTQVDSFTLALDQVGQLVPVEPDDLTARVITLPQNSDVAIPVGTSGAFYFHNDVEVTISAGAGATIAEQSGVRGDPRPTGKGAYVAWQKIATNEFLVVGDIVTVALEAAEHGFHPVRLSPPCTSILNTGWGFNTDGTNWNRSYVEEASPGTRRMWHTFISSDRHPLLSRRTILSPGGTVPSSWTTIDLTTKFTGLSGLVAKDGHHTIACHRDSDGYMHVMGNMHLHPVEGHYCVSRVVDSMTLSDFVPAEFESGATNKDEMTYPQFVECSDGTFILTYRDSSATGGADHRANQYIKRYTPNGSAPPASGANSRWGAAVKLCDGIDDPVEFGCIYLSRICTDPRDRATHWIFFHWRNDDDETVEKLGCIVTHDDFATFELADGTPLTLPFDRTDYTGAMVVDNVANQANTSFQIHGACVDTVPVDATDPTSLGRPHVVYMKASSGNIVLHRAYWDGSAWVVESTGNGMATSPNRCSIIADPNGGTYIVFTCDASGKNGTVRMFDATPGTAWTFADVEIIDMGWKCSDVAIPQQAQLDFDEAHFCFAQAGALADDDTTSADEPYYTEGFVASIDTLRLADIASGRATKVEPKAFQSVPIPGFAAEFTVDATSVSDIGSPRIQYQPTGIYMARIVGYAKITGTAVMDISIRQDGGANLAGNGTQLAKKITGTDYDYFETYWLPLRTVLFLARGFISARAGILSGSGTGVLQGMLQIQQVPVERL